MLASKSSQWLHRLRSARGFPDSDHMNLEHFLSNSLHKIDPQTSTDSAPPDKRPRIEKLDDGEAIQGRDMINNALSELFQMGEFQDLSRIKRKKSCRKQQCPRICVISTNSDAQAVPVQKDKDSSPTETRPPLPLPLTLNNRRKVKELNQESKVSERVEEEEEEKGYCDLSAFSQTEVTIIDTSVPSWKFEKMLYRRKNAWKVGDKKGKGLMSGDRKKRKEILNENGDVEKKKLKLCSSSSKSGGAEEGGLKKKKKKKRLKACDSSKNIENEEAIVRSKSTQGHEHCKTMAAVYEKKQDNYSPVQEKSSSFKKQIDGGSSVILIKSIPTTNKKDNSGIAKSCLKSMHK